MKTILIYDADADLVEIICMALELEGYTTFGFNNDDANYLDLIRDMQPALVLLDFVQTGEFSTKWCSAIKLCYPALPVIALSCNLHIGEIYAKKGFDDCISKPFDLEQLYSTIAKYLK